jgi:glutamate 5-kinase
MLPSLPCLTIFPGTSSIVDEATHQPILSILSTIVETTINLLHDGHRVIIVSSGAIGVGLRRMDIAEKPNYLPRVQVRPPLPDQYRAQHGDPMMVMMTMSKS